MNHGFPLWRSSLFRYWLTRLALLSVVFLAVWFGMEPLLRRFFVGFGERIVHSQVDIDDFDVTLSGCDMTLGGVQISNPHTPDRNLLECQRAEFDIEPYSVLERRLVVREARLSGVRFNTSRSGSAEDGLATLLPEEFDTPLEELTSGALRQLSWIMKLDLEKELLSLELAKELAAQWPADYDALSTRADKLRQEMAALRGDLDPDDDPRGVARSFPTRVGDVERLRRELREARQQLESLKQQIEGDRQAIDIARRHDHRVIGRKLAIRDLDPQGVTEYLLGTDLCDDAKELVGWVRLARQYWPEKVELPPGERSHGEDIHFPGVDPEPKALIHKMLLSGTFERSGHTIPWQGEVTNITTDPAVVGEPMTLRIVTSGHRPLTLQATLDRTGATPHDHVVMHIPQVPQGQRLFGKPDDVAVSAAPGAMQVWSDMQVAGEQLSGRIVVEQKGLRLSARLPERFGTRLSQRVDEALADVGLLQAEIKLGGTVARPVWQLKSNLGPLVATRIEQAVRAELATRQTELIALLDKYLQEQQQLAVEQIAARHQVLSTQLLAASDDLELVRRQVAGRIRVPGTLRDDEFPTGNPYFRR